jgi:hypothetical protein
LSDQRKQISTFRGLVPLLVSPLKVTPHGDLMGNERQFQCGTNIAKPEIQCIYTTENSAVAVNWISHSILGTKQPFTVK